MRVLIVDDHTVVRRGMEMFVTEVIPDALVSGEGTFHEGLEVIKSERIDLLILDINIPGGRHTEMVGIVRAIQSDIKILVFSALDEQKLALQYLHAGADGYLPKHAEKEEYLEAIQALRNDEKYISPSVQQELLNRISTGKPLVKTHIWQNLTDRELQIAKLLIEGLWTKEVAAHLNLRESTVSTFKKKIFEKTDSKSILDLAAKLRDAV